MKLSKENLDFMKVSCLKVWNRLVELKVVKLSILNERNTSDLWFRTWASINYPLSNPNCIRDAQGNRLLEYNPEFDLYPDDTNDQTLKTAYKQIYRYIEEKAV